MGNYNVDDTPPVEVPRERVIIGTIYLLLFGALLSGVVHLIAS